MKKLLFVLVAILVFAIGVFGGYFILTFTKLGKIFVGNLDDNGMLPIAEVTPIANPNDSYNILLLGYGGSGHDGGYLSDSIIVIHVDETQKKAVLISVPRDLWVPIPVDYDNTTDFKINAAYAIGMDNKNYPNKKPVYKGEAGGGNLAKEVIGSVIGMDVDYFVSVDFTGFSKLVDLLGGVDVNVPAAFDDYFFPIKGEENNTCGKSPQEINEVHEKYSGFDLEKQFTCRYEHLHFENKITYMDGTTALKFVRSRHSDVNGGDFARSERQFAILKAVKDKVISMQLLTKTNSIIDQMIQIVRTDLDKTGILQLYKLFGDPSKYTISSVHVSEDNVLKSSTGPGGQYILVPKDGSSSFDSIKNLVKSSIN